MYYAICTPKKTREQQVFSTAASSFIQRYFCKTILTHNPTFHAKSPPDSVDKLQHCLVLHSAIPFSNFLIGAMALKHPQINNSSIRAHQLRVPIMVKSGNVLNDTHCRCKVAINPMRSREPWQDNHKQKRYNLS